MKLADPHQQHEPLGLFLERRNAALINAYREDPDLLIEHHGIEETVLAGGYGYRQVTELIQNGADAILEAHPDGAPAPAGNRVHVLIEQSRLYVANSGAPLSKEGVKALLHSHSSPKRGNQIGRFGLGFKSLLRLGGAIDVFTRDRGAIRFDPKRCRQELMREFNAPEAPGLRLAWPLQKGEGGDDGVLGQFTWAETVVRVEIVEPETLEHLREEIRTFPAEFLLFFDIPVALVFNDGKGASRELTVERCEGDHFLLHDDGIVSHWRIAKQDVHITNGRALADATHLHARGTVPLAWAIPLEGKREEAGLFWFFIPTVTPTYLSGILNAPWKLNSDRNAIIQGEWNSALMEEAARLVAETLPSLSSTEDPGRVMDAFPRQMERKNADAAPLVETLWKTLRDAAVIPDGAGLLRPARELWRHPSDSVGLAQQWQALANPDDLTRFVHPSCMKDQRASRLNELAKLLEAQDRGEGLRPDLRRYDAREWLEAVASTDTSRAIKVLRLAEAYANDCKSHEWSRICADIAVIPSHRGGLKAASQLVLASGGVPVPGRDTVASALCEDPDAKQILTDVMKVQNLDEKGWSSLLLDLLPSSSGSPEARDAGWRMFWDCLRMAPAAFRGEFIRENGHLIRIRRRDATWTTPDLVLFPGALVNESDSAENRGVLFDPETHGEDSRPMKDLGVCECPEGVVNLYEYALVDCKDDGLEEWLENCRTTYQTSQQNSASWSYLKPFGLKMPSGWSLLRELSGAPNARLTERFLNRVGNGEFIGQVRFGHCTDRRYPTIDVPHPLPWFVLRNGTVQVGAHAVRLAAVLARRHEPVLARQSNWERLSPTLNRLQHSADACPPTQRDIGALWKALTDSLATPSAMADDSLQDLWTGAARDGFVPEEVVGEMGAVPLSQVFVTGSPDLARRARTQHRTVITLGGVALELWLSKSARNLSDLATPEWASTAGPAELLVSSIPEISDVLRSDVGEAARCQPGTGLQLRIDAVPEPMPCLMWEGVLLLDIAQLSQIPRVERMRLLINEVAGAEWLAYPPDEAMERLGNEQVEHLRTEVAKASSLADRLLRAVGGHQKWLRGALGVLGEMDFVKACSTHQLAELTLSQLGPATLPALRDALWEEGLKPPARWNTAEARSFVASIGFPETFAASPEAARDAEEFISGPIVLPLLHDFQEDVLGGIKDLVASDSPRRRAVVSLPTGCGKTRVTVEGAVRLILAPEGDRRSVLWVAQTDELCEQAVQTFRQVWVNLGAQGTGLRIVRLWGGNPSPAIQRLDKPLVVVSTIQTLNSRIGTEELTWLRKPGLVILDECHHAITPSYGNLLRWLNPKALRPAAPEGDEPPIIGLSATPFRRDDEESQRLAKRFDNLWFPADQKELHARLCAEGVLAQAEYEPLDSGASLLEEEVDRLQELPEPWEGLDFENIVEAINQRLAGDSQRSQRLVERILKGSERSILLFANSVQHAEEISARLNLAGVPSAAVSGTTATAARRYFLDRFQHGEIRALCNHTVLGTGFDAPKTDMVLIARQVFSPVRYMQMVGRGLRGERNGGTPRCRIISVIDNLGRFQDRHPYTYCESYFKSWS